ncbi:hypothetical protein [Stutzerimonas stutzeri]|uniref:hypothetical protein n=1 Tax=Stutzerimonas stutzeri TaxID=316 RepID=UPI000F83FF2D|nr:hypothetical protein [Stutzerimonas stutzeri]QQC13113.1 hypothetical protein I6I22_10020 [Stutzerimonas stutzeri]
MLAITNPAEPQDREQARAYEKLKHEPHVGASLLAITTLAEREARAGARASEEQKHTLRLDSVVYDV